MGTLPAAPSWLSADARAHWREIGAWLVGWGVMLDRYTPSLAALCVAYAQFIRIERAVRDAPLTIATAGIVLKAKGEEGDEQKSRPAEGGEKPNPAWAEFDRAYKRLMDALTRHGLTPSAAAGIVPAAKKPEEPTQGLGRLRLAN